MQGMLPNDLYNNGRASSCVREMIKTEGALSLFKGYWANTLAILLWMSLMPKVTNFMMEELPLYLDPQKYRQAKE